MIGRLGFTVPLMSYVGNGPPGGCDDHILIPVKERYLVPVSHASDEPEIVKVCHVLGDGAGIAGCPVAAQSAGRGVVTLPGEPVASHFRGMVAGPSHFHSSADGHRLNCEPVGARRGLGIDSRALDATLFPGGQLWDGLLRGGQIARCWPLKMASHGGDVDS